MPNSDFTKRPTDEELEAFERKTLTVLKALAAIAPDPSRLLWVPGNHDPLTLFPGEAKGEQQQPRSSINSEELLSGNLHGKVVEIAPELMIGGWGGCVEALEDGKQVWVPYPYPEAQVKDKLKALESVLEKDLKTNGDNPDSNSSSSSSSSLILMTHSGPDLSSTAQVTGVDPNSLHKPGLRSHIINSGSASLSRLLSSPMIQKSCILSMHGHTHQGMGLARVGGIPVLNPGSILHTGSYSLVTLHRKKQAASKTDNSKKHKEGDSNKSVHVKKGPWYVADIRTLFLERNADD
eukprot:CAMPEP_0185258970 /NCGR_PEP_ID=MMETSP1359-20130426/7835_1 /TAXON_ID=552665 /ORGANISM="Bigelowiella longifila, Strain CCMP242" /LENGTH=292 /DNA_ID=CAMNT_0027844705 /DNA_START=8 /DNA_END=886 /DNA_ORIENTATION=+